MTKLEEITQRTLRKVIAFDIETTGLDPFLHKPILAQWKLDRMSEAEIVDLRGMVRLPNRLQWILANPANLLLGHNLGFDLKMLKHHYGIEPKCRIFDTMLAESVLEAGRSFGLALEDLVWKYAGVLLDKSQRASFIGMGPGPFSEKQLDYAKRDVEHLHAIYRAQRDRLAEEQLLEIAQLEFDLLPAIIDMELNGIYLNTDLWSETMAELEIKRQEAEQELYRLYCPPDCKCQTNLFGEFRGCVNWDSHAQIKEAFRKHGMEMESTGRNALKTAVIEDPGNELLEAWVKALLNYRDYASLVKFDLPAYVHPKTGRIHPEFSQNGAKTGRTLCKNPNMHQVPKDPLFRRCVQAQNPDWVLVAADYGQIEMAVLAQEAQPAVMLDAIRKGLDLHALMAQKVYGDPEISKTNNGKLRNVGKTLDFATIYGAGATTIALTANIPVKEAKRALKIFHRTYPEIQRWWDVVLRNAAESGHTTTLAGRKRWFYGEEGELPRSAVVNTPVQGGAADIAKCAAVQIHKRIKTLRTKMIHFVHDETVVECHKEDALEVAEIQRTEMLEQTARWLPDVPVEVDCAIGRSWGTED